MYAKVGGKNHTYKRLRSYAILEWAIATQDLKKKVHAIQNV